MGLRGRNSLLHSAFAFACALMLAATAARTADAADPGAQAADRVELTAYPGFAGACFAFVNGYGRRPGSGEKLYPTLGYVQGGCPSGRPPLRLGVTQENAQNNHKGSSNYDENIVAYMGDFDYGTDFGSWLDLKLVDTKPAPYVVLKLDTGRIRTNTVTGWPLQYGHLYMGLADTTVMASLDQSVFIGFDIRVQTDNNVPLRSISDYNGRRVLVGALGTWAEAAPRTNMVHFLEVNVAQSAGFAASYNEHNSAHCQDVRYDRCFYGDGRYAEGRQLSYRTALGAPPIPDNGSEWTHVSIPVSGIFRRLTWVSPPTAWSAAKLVAVYIGIESAGATSTTIAIRNYHVFRSL